MPTPSVRPRRLRRTAAIRDLVEQHHLRVDDLVAPLFVREGIDEPQPIDSLPGVVQHTRASLRADMGDDLVVMADLCVDEYTDHGHCGIVRDDGTVDNDATLEVYARAAIAQATAGAQVVAPSGMM